MSTSSDENERKRLRIVEDSDDSMQSVEPEVPEVPEKRPPLTRTHAIERDESGEKHHLLLLLTGSIAVMKIPDLITEIQEQCGKDRVIIKVAATENALRLCQTLKLEFEDIVYEDKDEWSMWRERGDPILHIELRKWADSALIAPLDANSMAKMATGICDNLVTSIIRAWDLSKPCYYAPAMNTQMWENPLTMQHRTALKSQLKFKEICPISKELMCGDTGQGAMASVEAIAALISVLVRDHLAIRTVQH